MSKLSDFVDGGGISMTDLHVVRGLTERSTSFTAPGDGVFCVVYACAGGQGGRFKRQDRSIETAANGGSTIISIGTKSMTLGGGGNKGVTFSSNWNYRRPSAITSRGIAGHSMDTLLPIRINGYDDATHYRNSPKAGNGRYGGGGGGTGVSLTSSLGAGGGVFGASGGIGAIPSPYDYPVPGGEGGTVISGIDIPVVKGDIITMTIGAGSSGLAYTFSGYTTKSGDGGNGVVEWVFMGAKE